MSSIVKSFKFDNKPIIIDTSKSLEKVETTNVLVKLQQEVDRLNEEIKKAKREAEAIVMAARAEDSRLRADAEKFREEEMERTKHICEDIREEARRQAFDKGYAEGKDEAATRAKMVLDGLEQILKEALNKKDDIIRKSEQQVVQVALAIAKKLIRCEVSINPDIILNSVKEAISKIVDKDTLNIYMNLKDLGNFTQKKDEILKSLPVGSKVKIIEDNNIEPGGCVIATNMGNIDATISSQMLEIDKTIESEMRRQDGD